MTFSCKDKAALYAVSQGFQEDSYPSGTKAVWPTGFSWRFKKLFLNGKTKRVKFNEFSAAPFALSLIFFNFGVNFYLLSAALLKVLRDHL